jgi:hypothetical protein
VQKTVQTLLNEMKLRQTESDGPVGLSGDRIRRKRTNLNAMKIALVSCKTFSHRFDSDRRLHR